MRRTKGIEDMGNSTVLYLTVVLYIVALLISIFLVGGKKDKKEA